MAKLTTKNAYEIARYELTYPFVTRGDKVTIVIRSDNAVLRKHAFIDSAGHYSHFTGAEKVLREKGFEYLESRLTGAMHYKRVS